jgi:hypothetical protein
MYGQGGVYLQTLRVRPDLFTVQPLVKLSRLPDGVNLPPTLSIRLGKFRQGLLDICAAPISRQLTPFDMFPLGARGFLAAVIPSYAP